MGKSRVFCCWWWVSNYPRDARSGLVDDYRKSSSKPPGGFVSKGSLFERGCLFNLAKSMVLVLHKELSYEVENLKYKKLEVKQPRVKNKSELLWWWINYPRSVQSKFYSLDRLIHSRGGGGVGSTSLKEANGDMPLDGVALSRLDWL